MCTVCSAKNEKTKTRSFSQRTKPETNKLKTKESRASRYLSLNSLVLLLLLNLEKQSAVDVRQDTTKGDGGADECVEFLVTTNGELQVAGCDTLDLEILGSVLYYSSQSVLGHVCKAE